MACDLQITLGRRYESQADGLDELHQLLQKLLDLEALFALAGLRATSPERVDWVVTRGVSRRPEGEIFWGVDFSDYDEGDAYTEEKKGKVVVFFQVFDVGFREVDFVYGVNGQWRVMVEDESRDIPDGYSRQLALKELIKEHSLETGEISEERVMKFLAAVAKVFIPEVSAE